jgi:ubiquinone biosynthesis protein
MRLSAIPRFERNARRVAEILGVLSKYGLADWLSKVDSEWLQGHLVSSHGERLNSVSHEARIRLALTELGTTFIKFGQVLSTRADLIGTLLATELAKLRSHTPPDAPAAVRAIIQADLGKPIEELFSAFDDQPMASASIGQVHRARLLSGDTVVVKVQHAGIEEKILQDLDIMEGLAELLQNHVSAMRPYQPVATVREFRRTILRELDFTSERRHQEEFTRHFANDLTVRFPALHPSLCSRRVLTIELLTGISGENVEGLRQSGVDLDEFARRGAIMYLHMVFRDGFYHADPHAGNLMLLPGGVVGVLDCGMVGRIDERLREDIEDVLLAVVLQDTQELTDIALRVGAAPADLDQEALRTEVGTFLAEYTGQSVRDVNLSEALHRVMEVIRRFKIVLPAAGSLLLKTLVMLEGTSRQLNPQFSLAELIQPYATKALRRRLAPKRWLRKLQRAARDWNRLAEALPRDLTEILRRMRSGKLEIRHEHRRLETTVNRLVLGILTAALLVASAALWSLTAPPSVMGISVPGVIGYLLAVVLGFRLLRKIGKDGEEPKG